MQAVERVLEENKDRIRLDLVAAIVIAFAVGVTTLISVNVVNTISNRYGSILTTSQIIDTVKELRLAVYIVESSKRGYLLTREDKYLAPYYESLQNLDDKIASVRLLQSELTEQKQRIVELLGLIGEKISETRKVIHLTSKDLDRKAMRIVNDEGNHDTFTQIVALFNEIERVEDERFVVLNEELEEAQKTSNLLFIGFVGLCILLLTGYAYSKARSIRMQAAYEKELKLWADDLEQKVHDRTQELVVYSKELSRSNSELEEFAFVASHDLQEPLRKLRAFSDRLNKLYGDKLDEKGKDYLFRMDRSAARMSSLIEDLLEFSRIQTKGKEFEPVSLNEILDNLLDDMEVTIKEKSAEVISDDLPEIDADKSQMYQLFLNLISNAIKFTEEGVTPKICISSENIVEQEGGVDIDYHVIRIRDNGIGFDEKFSEKIFFAFQRLHSKSEYKGNGIGLAVCKRIVVRHGGDITAVSRPEGGAEFVIKIPALNRMHISTN